MSTTESPLSFRCREHNLVGIVHPADGGSGCGVLIVVGGPQYRIGSHRQFVLLARSLAAAGIPAMRFDTRGVGDSGGEFPGFENIDGDIEAAIDAFFDAVPRLDRVVLWGLCDAASAILFYAHRDSRVVGTVLVNPWVRSGTGLARTRLRHYYTGRLTSAAFWRRLATGGVSVGRAIGSFSGTIRAAVSRRSDPHGDSRGHGTDPAARNLPLSERMAHGMKAFQGPVLLILSGNDLTAREFEDASNASPLWRKLLSQPRVTRKDLAEADHTFSHHDWRDAVARWSRDWVEGLSG